mgnify:CR=1 FL=1
MTIQMNDDHTHDVNLIQSGVQVDENNLFHKDEKGSVQALNKLFKSKVELKHQRKDNFNLWIEYAIIVNGIEKPSCISITATVRTRQ